MAFFFLDLPIELRHLVYEFYFGVPRIARVNEVELAFLLVSTTVRNEVIPHIRRTFTFQFDGRDDVERIATLPVLLKKRTRSQTSTPHSRAYISKVRFVLDFIINREDNHLPLNANPFPSLPPATERAPISSGDITFFVGTEDHPNLNFIGTRFIAQYPLMVEILARRAVQDGNEIDSQLIFMRRNWDWVFKLWRECGFLDVEHVQFELRNFDLWMRREGPNSPIWRWRPVVDFLRLLTLAPLSINNITVTGYMAGEIRTMYDRLRSPVPTTFYLDQNERAVGQQMNRLYKSGKLGITPSKRYWYERLESRVHVEFRSA